MPMATTALKARNLLNLSKPIHTCCSSANSNSIFSTTTPTTTTTVFGGGSGSPIFRTPSMYSLHFDIKPHNILLAKDFIPKISDFGLAKLCPTRETIVSMVGARGTMGYIAPEISCRNLGLGGVSYKSDVYSYGMMVLEMIGGRKNLDMTVENMSGIYFPHWIYNQLKRDSKAEEFEIIKFDSVGEILKDAIARKMIIVTLWCIQTHPTNRPSMTKVVEMLEGSDEELQMPPNPSTDHVSLSSSSST